MQMSAIFISNAKFKMCDNKSAHCPPASRAHTAKTTTTIESCYYRLEQYY